MYPSTPVASCFSILMRALCLERTDRFNSTVSQPRRPMLLRLPQLEASIPALLGANRNEPASVSLRWNSMMRWTKDAGVEKERTPRALRGEADTGDMAHYSPAG